MKVLRLERDLPKYLRSKFNWMESLNEQEREIFEGKEGEKAFKRESIEDELQQKGTGEVVDSAQ
eukprot:CAMPEP_0202968360 /NCGR_PEP_ID=MMETSP1396-20130829/13624_1 /ASSEMBLY_ACC=CAM_ASM_000872 /TAXON_ID= /ORGANISM="Pseudokeronopsis sp., Strain Brazil" /LENGTH=63 /DNA_ID=CAMNT_0049694577 /DNA_START=375 /DNA_END=566 /DNA_ORIENTATION=+